MDIKQLTQLKDFPFNDNNDRLVRVLIDLFNGFNDEINTINTHLTALDGEIPESLNMVRDTDSFTIQLLKENGESLVTSDINAELWETLDLSNLPTNFTDGTELMITFLSSVNSQTATDWNTAVGTNPTVGNHTGENTIRIKLKTGTTHSAYLQSIQVDSTAVTGCQVMIESVPNWNNTANSIITMIPFAFNGAGLQEGVGISILRSNITTYIESIKRKL